MAKEMGRPARIATASIWTLVLFFSLITGAVHAEERGGGVIRAIDLPRLAIQVNARSLFLSPSVEVRTPGDERLHGLAGIKHLEPGMSVSYTLEQGREGPPRIERLRIRNK